MARLSPLLTLILGYVMGYILYPVLQVWTCTCIPQDNNIMDAQPAVILRRINVPWPVQVDSGGEPKYNRSETAVEYAPLKQLSYVSTNNRYFSSEYKTRGQLFIGVITTEKYLLTRAKAIHETWASELDASSKLVFYVGSDCNTSHPDLKHMNIIRLENVSDVVYPPQKKVFAALKHMYRFHGSHYKWFVRADDDVYIRVSRLESLLKKLDSDMKIYLGRPGIGKEQDISRLKLMSNEHYCMGGPGVVLSKATLSELGPQLDSCLMAIDRHNKAVTSKDEAWFNEDVELGRCISRTLGIQCSTSKEVMSYFMQDYSSDALKSTKLWSKRLFKKLITVHPIKQPEYMYNVHLYYTVKNRNIARDSVTTAAKNIKELCRKIPQQLLLTSMHICPAL